MSAVAQEKTFKVSDLHTAEDDGMSCHRVLQGDGHAQIGVALTELLDES